jgi:hypothetical protein
VTLLGTNFMGGFTDVGITGKGVTVKSVTGGGSTSLTATFTISVTAPIGPRNVAVTTPGGVSVSKDGVVFNVIDSDVR